MSRLREYTSDILLQTYLLLQQAYKEQGEQVVYDMLSQGMRSDAQPLHLEVLFFAAKSIYDGFNDDLWNIGTINFISGCFYFITKEAHPQSNFCLVRACLQFVYETAQPLKELKQFINSLIDYCLRMVAHQKLRSLALNTIFEICQYCNTQFTEQEITPLYHYLQNNYADLATEHASKLVEAAGIVAAVQDQGDLEVAIVEIAKMPAQMLVSPNRNDLIKSMVVMSALVTAIHDIPTVSLKNSLGRLFNQTWPYCQQFLSQRSGD